MKKENDPIRILFIGNSHTYYFDLPAWVAMTARMNKFSKSSGRVFRDGVIDIKRWKARQKWKQLRERFGTRLHKQERVGIR